MTGVASASMKLKDSGGDRVVSRVRRWAAVVALVALTTAGGACGAERPAGDPRAGLPSQLQIPPVWTGTVEQSAPGRVAVLFGGSATTGDWSEGRIGAVAAAADRYRVFDDGPYTPPGFEALLSPDGSLIARAGGLWDLTRGTRRASSGTPLAFSPDGRFLVSAAAAEFVDGDRYVTPYVEVRDLTGAVTPVRVPVGDAWIPPGWSAAMSADGRQLALQVRDEVWLVDPRGGAGPGRRVDLAGGRLAGPAAWSPEGGTISVVRRGSCAGCWQVERRTATDGRPDGTRYPEVTSAAYVRVIGWRNGIDAVALVGTGPGDDRLDNHDSAWGPYKDDTVHQVSLVLLRPGATAPEVVWRTPAGVSEADVAAGIAATALVRRSGPASYGPPHPLMLIAGGLAVVVTAAVVGVVLAARRRRARRPE